jgi:2-dehydropantoate 2-reductase
MKICIFGAGAIGGHLAARLHAAGVDISVVARGEQLAAIRRDGLSLEIPDGPINARIPASDDPGDLGPQDAVIVAVKAPALPDVAARIAPLLRPDTPVVFAMNGIPWWYFYAHGGPFDGRRLPRLDPGDAVWNAVGPQRAVGGVIHSSNTVIRPGVVRCLSGRMQLIVGEPTGEKTARALAIAEAITAGGGKGEVSPRIRDAVWIKLIANMSANPLTFLAQTTLGAVFAEPACVAAVRTVAAEGAAIARALGCNVELDIDKVFAGVSAHKPSIVQDLERGRPLELDAMFTVPSELGQMLGVETPMLDLIVTLMKLRARAAGLYADRQHN